MTQHMQDSGESRQTYEQDLSRLNDLIADIDIAMLTTRDDDGSLRSRPMGTQSKGEFNGTLHFFTDITSHKTIEVDDDSDVNVAYSNPGSHKYASLSGVARISQDQEKLEQHWNPALKVWFPQGLDDPNLALLSVEVSKAEFWDSYSKPATLLAMAKALITGKQAKMGEDKQLNLKRGTSESAQH
ncbi:MAG: pyridoxamine 5'-phosphate oxidase family protein [Stagnimonas sp.]|nr:pyridoxamine 5'-phosphate oxidase family protein [Stagnimonas sp.]